MTTDSETAARLEQEIAQTRAHIDVTLDAIQERLSPGRLVDRALDYAKENGGAFAGNLGRSVRDNPMPVALLGIGVGWLMLAGNRPIGAQHGGYTGEPNYGFPVVGGERRPEEQTSSIVETGEQKAHAWTESARGVAEAAGSRVKAVRHGTAEVAGRMKDRAEHAKSSLSTFVEENPLAIGVLAIAAGAVFGALIPTTKREGAVLGTASDRLKEAIGSEVRNVTDAVSDGATNAADESKPHARPAEERPLDTRNDRGSTAASSTEPAPVAGPIGPS